MLKPVIVRYQGKVLRIYFGADAAFAMPGVYECLEAERVKYAIRLPANQGSAEQDCLPAQAPGRTAAQRGPAVLRQFHLQGGKLDQASPGGCQGRVAPGRTYSARRLHRHQYELVPPSVSSPSTTSAARASNGSRKARERSIGRGCHAGRSRPTPCGSSFMHSPTILATSCARWRHPSRSRTGR